MYGMLFCLANSVAVSNSTSLLSVRSALLPTCGKQTLLKVITVTRKCFLRITDCRILFYIIFYHYSRKIGIFRKLLHLRHPLLDVVEADLVGDIEHDDDAERAAVAAGEDGAVPLLAAGVPHLHLHLLVVDDGLPGADVHPDGRDEVVGARVVQEFV